MLTGVCISRTSLLSSAAMRDSLQLSSCGYFMPQSPVFIDSFGVGRAEGMDEVKCIM